jgi:hypothetical protein
MCLATANTTRPAAKRASHPQTSERHEDAQICTHKTKQNQQAQRDQADAPGYSFGGKEEREGNNGEQNTAANLRKVKPESE